MTFITLKEVMCVNKEVMVWLRIIRLIMKQILGMMIVEEEIMVLPSDESLVWTEKLGVQQVLMEWMILFQILIFKMII